MTTQTQWNRDPLELPETVQIAQLLAELMPSPGDKPKPPSTTLTPSKPSGSEVSADSPADSEVVAQTGPATFAVVEAAAAKSSAAAMTAPIAPPPLPRHGVESSRPMAEPASTVPMRELRTLQKEGKSDVVKPPPLPATPASPASTLERIPLGDLTVAGFFSLVNWRNDPGQVRHAPLAPRFDAETTAELKKIPFIALETPPADDTRSVAAVLKSFAW